MEDDLRPGRVEDCVRVADVGDVKLGSGRHVLAAAGREIVEDVHLVAAGQQRIRHVRADEACPSGDDRPHASMLGAWCS